MENYNEFEQEPTLQERYDEAAKRVIEVYGKCIEEGRYDSAWNKLSPALYNLRSLFLQMQDENDMTE